MATFGIREWERKFRSDAKADNLLGFRDHLGALGLRGKPESLLKGTILVVQACSAYAEIDGQSFTPFLAMQTYKPRRAGAAKYAFTFDLCSKSFSRVLADADWAWRPKAPGLDLADLYGHPWQVHKVVGFSDLWITRVDRKALTAKEMKRLEEEVTDDLLFDYSEDELDIQFDDSPNFNVKKGMAHAFLVHVQDHENDDER